MSLKEIRDMSATRLRCPEHRLPLATYVHSKEHDAYFCPNCGIWLTAKCPNFQCGFCITRPDNALVPQHSRKELESHE